MNLFIYGCFVDFCNREIAVINNQLNCRVILWMSKVFHVKFFLNKNGGFQAFMGE